MTLGPEAVDALCELVTVSCGHAAGALSKLMGGRRVMIDVPKAAVTRVENVADLLGDRNAPAVAVYLEMRGDMAGEFLLIQPEADAKTLGRSLIGAGDLDSDLVQSALCEVGNIVASSCFTAIAKFVGLKLLPSVPGFSRQRAGKLGEEAAARRGESGGEAVVLETRFSAPGDSSFYGFLILLPESKSVPGIVRALKRNAAPLARA